MRRENKKKVTVIGRTGQTRIVREKRALVQQLTDLAAAATVVGEDEEVEGEVENAVDYTAPASWRAVG